jgi:hypothetical protein
MLATKDKWQLIIVIHNAWQFIMPFFDHADYILPKGSFDQF